MCRQGTLILNIYPEYLGYRAVIEKIHSCGWQKVCFECNSIKEGMSHGNHEYG